MCTSISLFSAGLVSVTQAGAAALCASDLGAAWTPSLLSCTTHPGHLAARGALFHLLSRGWVEYQGPLALQTWSGGPAGPVTSQDQGVLERHKLSAEMGTLRPRGRWRSRGQNRSSSLRHHITTACSVRHSGPSMLPLPQSLQVMFPATNRSLSWPGRIPRWLSGKESACQCRRHRFDPWVGKIHWRRE